MRRDSALPKLRIQTEYWKNPQHDNPQQLTVADFLYAQSAVKVCMNFRTRPESPVRLSWGLPQSGEFKCSVQSVCGGRKHLNATCDNATMRQSDCFFRHLSKGVGLKPPPCKSFAHISLPNLAHIYQAEPRYTTPHAVFAAYGMARSSVAIRDGGLSSTFRFHFHCGFWFGLNNMGYSAYQHQPLSFSLIGEMQVTPPRCW